MSDIFQEVDEEVRRDKAAEFWKKHQNLIFGAAALIVLASAGYRFYDYQRAKAAEAAGAQFQQALAALQADKGADASATLDAIAAQAPAGYRAVARLTAAGLKAKTDASAAIAAFDALGADASLGPLFQDAARLRAALLRLDIAAEAAKGEAELKTLAGGASVYRRTARLALGALALGRQDTDGAASWLNQVVADPEASRGERQQAEHGLGLVAANKASK